MARIANIVARLLITASRQVRKPKAEPRPSSQAIYDYLLRHLRFAYYQLTTAGRSQLRSGTSVWKRYANAVFKVLETT